MMLLAETYDPLEHDPSGWWMSEKLDGVRAYWDGAKFVSRNGNQIHAPAWFTAGLPTVALDGELWMGRGKFQQTEKTIRGEDWTGLSFVVFDAPLVPGGFEVRIDALQALLANAPDHIRIAAHTQCDGPDHLRAELTRVEALGGEGLMLRQPCSKYTPKRSFTLLKAKSFKDTEAEVVGHRADASGWTASLVLRLPNGVKFSVGSGMSESDHLNPPAVGEIVTFRFQEFTEKGAPRFPVYVGVRA